MWKLQLLLDNNRRWAKQRKEQDPSFFTRLSRQQNPDYLWIGCSDSRVPANEIVGLDPGELFVHRNVGNVVTHNDLNCQSVIQYAVEVLDVEHIIVCGHYGCGGVQAALENRPLGLIDGWLTHIREVYATNQGELDAMPEHGMRLNRLCELNIGQQLANVCYSESVQAAWRRGQSLSVHGLIYDIHDGLLRDLNLCITAAHEISPIYRLAKKQ